jgi:hypothetical protein
MRKLSSVICHLSTVPKNDTKTPACFWACLFGTLICSRPTFFVTLQRQLKMSLRLLAAAQHSSSELGSALALHINCHCHSKDRLASGKRMLYFGKEALFLRESKKNP